MDALFHDYPFAQLKSTGVVGSEGAVPDDANLLIVYARMAGMGC